MQRNIYRRRKKKPVLLILLICLLAIAMAFGLVFWSLSQRLPQQPSSSDDTPPVTTTTTRRPLPVSFIDNNTFSPRVILYDVTDREVLYQKQADEKCAPASLTKLMTALVATEYASADTTFTIGNEIYMIDPASSRAYLSVGSKLSLPHLMEALLLPSGNDAAYAMAVGVGRLIANNPNMSNKDALSLFVEKMNEKALALGCENTHFKNPDGIDTGGHETTAADLVKICVAALDDPIIAQTMAMERSNYRESWQNTNKLLRTDTIYTYEGAIGLKTGSTDGAGYCLAAAATRDGKTSLVIVMGAKAESNRFDDAAGLLDLSFQ